MAVVAALVPSALVISIIRSVLFAPEMDENKNNQFLLHSTSGSKLRFEDIFENGFLLRPARSRRNKSSGFCLGGNNPFLVAMWRSLTLLEAATVRLLLNGWVYISWLNTGAINNAYFGGCC